MRKFRDWKLGRTPGVEVLTYAPEQAPPLEDIDDFVCGARIGPRLLPLQTARFVLRETYQTRSWLRAYVHCEVDDLRAKFVQPDKSFYIALLEHTETGDRSVSFRLTTAGLDGHTEWRVTFRRVHFEANSESFLCAE
jgi:hypothetical protein